MAEVVRAFLHDAGRPESSTRGGARSSRRTGRHFEAAADELVAALESGSLGIVIRRDGTYESR